MMALAGMALAAAFLPDLLLSPPPGWILYVLYACFAFTAAFAALFMLAALMPRWFLTGVALQENGFEYRRPLRKAKRIRYDSIDRVHAVKAGDGEAGDDIRLVIYSNGGRAILTPEMLHRSGILKALESRLPLNGEALRNALRYEPRGMDLLLGRRFTIYERQTDE